MSHHKSSVRHPRWLIEAAPRIIKHMNEDHANSITSTLNGQHGIKDKNAKMDTLELHGYYIRSTGELYFVKFTKTCASTQEYKSELVKHAHLYRDFELS
tara:strand:+ start:423 stop:719 length:297 start_codon:yes stop_codon:yes gene_type:complete